MPVTLGPTSTAGAGAAPAGAVGGAAASSAPPLLGGPMDVDGLTGAGADSAAALASIQQACRVPVPPASLDGMYMEAS
eukprot:8906300-Prorocentrum_lima.AAC.1